ncbi:MAG: 23S rRNA (adenine(2503)-C(2))-methyltransferase RlmN [Burkholderiales bacterium]|jgi:23S rRNA (adenine2503-C2)-methyltransferase|tara:strand:+ start:24675 stop:25844 length:1170 start_codon:yes stop_codon:yes gene_type:complete
MSEKINLLDLDRDQLAEFLKGIGENSFRSQQLFKWIHQRGVVDLNLMTDLSKSLRDKLGELVTIKVPKFGHENRSDDGTLKWLFPVDNANSVEAVFIPEKGRGTLCVSSQAGCALECAFCATGREGFNRNLKVSEIIGQLWLAQNRFPQSEGSFARLEGGDSSRPVSNVVLMGMGEPLTNYDNVVHAVRIMLDDFGYGLSRRRVTVSTSGIVPNIDRLREDCPVSLAVSLHAPNDELRSKIVPINKKYPIADLMEACKRYTDSSQGEVISGVKWQRRGSPRDFVTFEYIMLDGVNDMADHARQLVNVTRGVPCKFNLIPFNPFNDSGFTRSSAQAVSNFQKILMNAGLVTTVRKTRGDDIAGACGQLAGQLKNRRTPRRNVNPTVMTSI